MGEESACDVDLPVIQSIVVESQKGESPFKDLRNLIIRSRRGAGVFSRRV